MLRVTCKHLFHCVHIPESAISNDHCNFNNKGKNDHSEHISEENGIFHLEYEIISIMYQLL